MMRDFLNRTLLYLISVFVLAMIGVSISSFTLAVQAKADINYLQSRIASLEYITQPPKVSVLSEEISISLNSEPGPSLSISKLIIEDLGLNTMVRAEITNKSNENKVYQIANRKAIYTQEGYQDMTIDSPYVVVPLTSTLTIEAGEKKPIVVMVSKLSSDNYENTEAWISVMEGTNAKVQSELILRILIKGN